VGIAYAKGSDNFVRIPSGVSCEDIAIVCTARVEINRGYSIGAKELTVLHRSLAVRHANIL
jgi:hypothetical protein